MQNDKIIFLIGLSLWFYISANGQQTQTDSYTQYELLAPESGSFRIIYDVSATSAGAQYYWNTLRNGSEHTVDAVWDLFSGAALPWEIVDGTMAKKNGHSAASEETDYLQITLKRPIPKAGESRLRIDKTYIDTASYYSDNEGIVFSRTLGIKRNSIILPQGYELTHCNYPAQIQLTDDARIKISFLNRSSQPVSLVVRAKALANGIHRIDSKDRYTYDASGNGRNKTKARLGWQFEERAFQNREIVYYLQQPETHSFLLYHDYTETRPGIDRYLNIVRLGSNATNPSALLLDTGEELKVETLKGDEITKRGIHLDNPISEKSEVIAIWFDPVEDGKSKRLRITETYTDPNRYLLHGEELVWDRSFGRNRNTVVLPLGWFVTANAIPAIVDQNDRGQTQLHFINDRPDVIDVYIRAQRK